MDGSSPRAVWYDDDETECFCGKDGCMLWYDDDKDEEVFGEEHMPIHKAICYEHPDEIANSGEYTLIDHADLYAIGGPADADGWVYAVVLAPDIAPNRIKVGYTKLHVSKRLANYKTSNPDATIIGLWRGGLNEEAIAHGVVPGRIGRSEVFDCGNIAVAITKITDALREPCL